MPDQPIVVTIDVHGETFRILMTESRDIEIARDLLAGKEAPGIPNGRVIYGDDGEVNTGYRWHIDPADVEWADGTIELCDGLPSAVGTPNFTSDRFCPWGARVIAVDPA